MRWSSLLLRVLLSLCVVLNGTATAATSVRSVVSSQATVTAAPTDNSTTPQAHAGMAGMPCHGGGSMALPDTTRSHHATAPASDSAGIRTPHPWHDCCGSSHCHCACSLHVPLALLTATISMPPYGTYAPGVRRLSLTYAPPALADPMRPPIV